MPDEGKRITAELIALEQARRRAIAAQDVETQERMTADHFHYAHITGMVEDRAAYFARQRRGSIIIATSARDIEVTLRPGYALMHGHSSITVDPASDGFDVECLFLAVWEQQGDDWKISAYVSTPAPNGPAIPAPPV